MTTFAGFPDDAAEAAPAKRRHVDREHSIQKHAKMWAGEQIDVPHEFLAFDRSAPWGQWSHAREKARGVRKGTADTVLLLEGRMFWCEFKAPGSRPDDAQRDFGDRMRALGWTWGWTDSVAGYCALLRAAGVPLRNTAAWGAADHDARVAAEIARAEAKAPSRKVARAAKPSVGAIARAHKAGVWRRP